MRGRMLGYEAMDYNVGPHGLEQGHLILFSDRNLSVDFNLEQACQTQRLTQAK